MTDKTIDMKEFSKTPYGRYDSDGKFNGEAFRKKFLIPALNEGYERVFVNLDSVEKGYEYGSSFLEESFAGLIRYEGLTAKDLSRIIIKTKHEDYILEIKSYIDRAEKDRLAS